MSFRFSARSLLALGQELISSDEVALYELIKNAVDAESSRVEIIVNVQLRGSHYREALQRVEEGSSPSKVGDFILRQLANPKSVDSITLLDELRSSSRKEYLDNLKRLYETLNYIEVRDSGHGMSLKELSDVFLRIGTSSRRRDNLAGARHLGDKGIGRLSAMRLGNRLRVKTSRNTDRYWNLLDIDWTRFFHDDDDDIDADAITIEPEIGDEKTEPAEHGTTIRISALQGDWDLPRFSDVLQGKIARMIDPFVPGLANRLIVARHNGTRVQVPSIPRELLRSAHAVCHIHFRLDGHTPVLEGEIDYRYRHRKRKINARGPEIYSLAKKATKRRAKRGHAAFTLVPIRPVAFESLGDFSCDIYWFNRRVVAAVEGLTSTSADTRREISNWSGGPMLYRYGFRILPYGDPKDDWLSLDEIAFGVGGFKLNRQQMIGRVLTETPHLAMSEQTNRQGLIDSDTFTALQKILLWVVHTEMRGLINEADTIELIERRAADQDTKTASKARVQVDAALKRLRDHVGATAADEIDVLSKSVSRLTEQSQQLLKRMEAVIEEAVEEREKFVYLAGIGLMTEFIFHELERAVSYTMDVISRGEFSRRPLIRYGIS